MENIEIVEDPLGINGKLTYCEGFCFFCNRGIKNEKDRFKTKFLNVGKPEQTDEFICCNCGNKVSVKPEKFVVNKFGYYFVTQ